MLVDASAARLTWEELCDYQKTEIVVELECDIYSTVSIVQNFVSYITSTVYSFEINTDHLMNSSVIRH